ncbi:hypothetical protein, partial [Pseudomonas sp. FW305-E2]|uniref:hypothetical protein n=1 Tax=Pseudomonas sp. FW305-E2 TaxID=2075558 RepID=UPI001C44BEA1
GFPRFHISNPFDYTSLTKEDEQLPIYVQMLLNMAKNSSVFLLNGNPNWNSIESQIRGSVFFAPYELSGDFPYKREMHPSAMG